MLGGIPRSVTVHTLTAHEMDTDKVQSQGRLVPEPGRSPRAGLQPCLHVTGSCITPPSPLLHVAGGSPITGFCIPTGLCVAGGSPAMPHSDGLPQGLPGKWPAGF